MCSICRKKRTLEMCTIGTWAFYACPICIMAIKKHAKIMQEYFCADELEAKCDEQRIVHD